MAEKDVEVEQLVTQKEELDARLLATEKQIHSLEATYLEKTAERGNVFHGWDTYLTPGPLRTRQSSGSQHGSLHLSRKPRWRDSDRLFSLSSVTSPASRALEANPEAAAACVGQGIAVRSEEQLSAAAKSAAASTATSPAPQPALSPAPAAVPFAVASASSSSSSSAPRKKSSAGQKRTSAGDEDEDEDMS